MSSEATTVLVVIWVFGVMFAGGSGWRFAAAVVWPVIVLRQAAWAIMTGSHEADEEDEGPSATSPEPASSSTDTPDVGTGNTPK